MASEGFKETIYNELLVRFIQNANYGDEIIVEHGEDRAKITVTGIAEDGRVDVSVERLGD